MSKPATSIRFWSALAAASLATACAGAPAVPTPAAGEAERVVAPSIAGSAAPTHQPELALPPGAAPQQNAEASQTVALESSPPTLAMLLPAVGLVPQLAPAALPSVPQVTPASPVPIVPQASAPVVGSGSSPVPAPVASGLAGGDFHEGGVVFDNPYGFPARVDFPAPSALVSDTGSHYTLMSGPDLRPALLVAVAPYIVVTVLVDAILLAASALKPVPGQLYTFNDSAHPGKQTTVRLDILADHARLSAWRGTAPAVDQQLLSLSWTSPTKGTFVCQSLAADGDPKHTAVHSAFDLLAGNATTDVAVYDPHGDGLNGPQWTAEHLALQTGTGATTYTVRASMTVNKPSERATPTTLGLAANFGAPGGAFWLAFGNKNTAGKLIFWPADGISFLGSPKAAHGFYLAPGGALADAPDASLKALLPPDSELAGSFPSDPGNDAAFSAAAFNFER